MSSFLQDLINNGKSTILLTGCSTGGLGVAFGMYFSALGHSVIMVCRNSREVDAMKRICPHFQGVEADLSSDVGRKALKTLILTDHPQVNVLINNAGVCTNPPLLLNTTPNDWMKHTEEINTNLAAPIHLSTLLLPHFMAKQNALMVNMTSIYGFTPVATHPTFCATKAGMHSFTQSLRAQLLNTSVKVFEIVAPLIDTPHTAPEFKGQGMTPDEFAKNAIDQLLVGKTDEITVGTALKILRGSRNDLDDQFSKWSDEAAEKQKGAGKEEKGEKKEEKKEVVAGVGKLEKMQGMAGGI